MGMGFDWGYWFMTTLPFRPCDLRAVVGEQDAQHIYVNAAEKLQERRAGGAAAKRCWWFTDNPHITYDHDFVRNQSAAWYDPLGQTWPRAILWMTTPGIGTATIRMSGPCCLVETGSFTVPNDGRAGRVHLVADGAWLLYVMCLIPIFAILTFWYLVFTSARFNRKRHAMISQTGSA